MRRRLANAYFSSVISISLVLLLVGVASMLLLNTGKVSDYLKESMGISVLFKPDVSDRDALAFKEDIDSKKYIHSAELISRERGEKEMKELLGEDFLSVFKTSPIPLSLNVALNAAYVTADSIAVVKQDISASPLVDEVVYQQTLVDALNANLSKISMVLGVLIVLLLFISFVLINNTMRLTIYSKRFIIHTMSLVGATKSYIRWPFLLRAAILGLFSAMVAIILIIAMLFVVKKEFVQMFFVFDLETMLSVFGIMIAAGLVICVVSTYFVVNKLVSLRNEELYL